MAPRRLPFDFDINELPPPEDDDAVVAATPSPAREPSSPRGQLPPPSPVLSPPPPVNDTSPAAPVPEPSSPPQDQLVPASPLLSPHTSLPPPPVFGLCGFPAPARELSPRGRYSSPVMDLESSLSLLDDEDDEEDEEEDDADTSRPSPEASAARVSSRVSSDAAPPSRETPAARVSPRGPRDAASSHRSRRRPSYDVDDPRDDAISKRRGGHDDEDEDAGSPRGRRRHEAGRRGRAPAAHGQPGAPRRTWRRRRRRSRRQLGHDGRGQRREEQPPRGREQQKPMGFRGPERPQAHHDGRYGGPHGRASPEFPPPVLHAGYRFSFTPPPPAGPRGRERHGRQSQAQQAGDQSSFRPPSAGPHGRDGSSSRHGWIGRQSQAQLPPPPPPAPKLGGAYHLQHREREVSAFRPHGMEDYSSGRRRRQAPAAQQEAPNGGGGGGGGYGYDQRRRHGPGRPHYHPYARDGGFDRANAGKHDRANYQHRRDSMKSTAGGPAAAAHGRQYYGDVRK
ncbi:hypothetical protein ACP4OV_028706 [Aristida adscensionis]